MFTLTTKQIGDIVNESFPDNPVSTVWVRIKIRGRTYKVNGKSYYIPPLLLEGRDYKEIEGRYLLTIASAALLIRERREEVNRLNKNRRRTGIYNKIGE